MEIENKLDNQERDDSKDIVVIDYYDRINKRWIKLEVTKEVARLLHNEKEKTRKGNNRYNRYNLSFDEVFDSTKKDNPNEKYLADENGDPQTILEQREQHRMEEALKEEQRVIIQNAMPTLTQSQQDVIGMMIYDNMSYSEMAEARGVKNKSSIYKIVKGASKNVKKFIEDNQN